MRQMSCMRKVESSHAMIVMLDTSQDLDVCAKEIGCDVEQLFTPLTRYNAQKPEQKFGMDNGAFSKFDAKGFLTMLAKHKSRQSLCRFVSAPDVVGDARRTLECFRHWQASLNDWPVALVCQDGQENLDIPWNDIAAVFIGGSTKWKLGTGATAIVKASKVMGKWCHIGRVNTPGRFEYFEGLGADSCDGTGLSQYSSMRAAICADRENPRLNIELSV